jgi:amino acid transporter
VNVFTLGKLVPLAVFIMAGVFFIDGDRFTGFMQPRVEGFGEATLLLMFAYGGYELITLPAGEARSPNRDVPAALLMTIAFVSGVFLLVQIVTVGTLAGLAASETPLADAARSFMGPVAGLLIAVGGLISIAGSNAGTMLAGPRVTYALGERGQLPGIFAHVHPRFRTPDFSILLYSAVALGLALSGTFVQMAAVSAVARLIFYTATCAAVPVLRRRPEAAAGGFRLPAGPVIPVLALLSSLALLAGADRFSLQAGAIALVVGGVLYVLGRRRE